MNLDWTQFNIFDVFWIKDFFCSQSQIKQMISSFLEFNSKHKNIKVWFSSYKSWCQMNERNFQFKSLNLFSITEIFNLLNIFCTVYCVKLSINTILFIYFFIQNEFFNNVVKNYRHWRQTTVKFNQKLFQKSCVWKIILCIHSNYWLKNIAFMYIWKLKNSSKYCFYSTFALHFRTIFNFKS